MSLKNTIKGLIGGAKKAEGEPTSIPVTPEPNYVCANCGMLIESCHGHTIEECHDYREDPTNPDLRAHRTILPSRNQPKINLPHYHSSARTPKVD